MKKLIRICLCLAWLAVWTLPVQGQVLLVDNGHPVGRIVIATDTETDRRAAWLLQDFVQRMSGATLPVAKTDAAPRRGDLRISTGTYAGVGEDGFRLRVEEGKAYVEGGEGQGSLYGVVTLLEQYLDCHYWGENEYTIPSQPTVELPALDCTDNPAFRYRQTQNYALATDSVYKWWNRLEEPSEAFAANYWVHTFDRLLPSAVYGEEHPEYYSWFNGKRHPGKASQWCLTNPEVFEIVAQRIDSIFKANPGKHIISVSQNDGNYTNCVCDSCRAVDEYEGALSGNVIRFLNKLAARFPDKEFSTLAYLYTMNPPKHVRPLPNVNIMLCDIDCKREVPLTENASGRAFMQALEGWSAITDNIFVWDYGINFDGYLTPFPNFHIMQENIRLFKKHHATMHFSQIASSRGGDFAELRSYFAAKLMWNPEADADSLMHTFLDGYYHEAGPWLYQYIKVMEGALLGSGIPLWIYDSPVTHKAGMLRPELLRRYNALFDRAEQAVATDSVALLRVQRSRLPLQYSELEIARTESDKDVDDIRRKLQLFEERARLFNVPTINERNNSPLDYCRLYRERYLPRATHNLAAGARITYIPAPGEKYRALGETALTDGLYGGATYADSWVGWEGVDASFVMDLGEEKEFRSIDADFLHQLGAWILLPRQVSYSVSADGTDYRSLGTYDLPEDKSVQVKFVSVRHESSAPVRARYIRVDIVGTKECPHWHYGVGHPCWFFLDEVNVE